MNVTEQGVDVHLSIAKDYDRIPSDTLAVVANRSAVGEQFVDLQPNVDDGPYLGDDSQIAVEDTRTPLATSTLLTHISNTVNSVDTESLSGVVHEFGQAFGGTGADLSRIIDTSNSFIETANENFDVTTALIKDSNTVLQTQADSASSIRTFSKNLALFSGSLAGSDKDLRAVIDSGSATAIELRTFLEDNEVDLAELINSLVTTGEIVVKHLDGVEQILVVYPYVVEGGFTVVAKDPATGRYDAHFGMVLTDSPVCHRGYESTNTRPPQDGSNRPMNGNAHCAEPAAESNARGAAQASRVGAAYRSPVVATYDPETGRVRWGDNLARDLPATWSLVPRTLGGDSWKWLFLQPLVQAGE
jgi:phospholipid/cholesterol/gamma-HCH transport system substrate-binding protein